MMLMSPGAMLILRAALQTADSERLIRGQQFHEVRPGCLASIRCSKAVYATGCEWY